jgi:hypothetical protein
MFDGWFAWSARGRRKGPPEAGWLSAVTRTATRSRSLVFYCRRCSALEFGEPLALGSDAAHATNFNRLHKVAGRVFCVDAVGPDSTSAAPKAHERWPGPRAPSRRVTLDASEALIGWQTARVGDPQGAGLLFADELLSYLRGSRAGRMSWRSRFRPCKRRCSTLPAPSTVCRWRT